MLDPDAFADALRACLPRADIGAARATFVRYKPATHCLAAYRIEVAGIEMEVCAKAYHADAYHELRTTHAKLEGQEAIGLKRTILEDAVVDVRAFPGDKRLPTLDCLNDERGRRRLLSALLPDRPDLWRAALHSLQYKPERRYVARLASEAGEQGVLKIYEKRLYRKATCASANFVNCSLPWMPRLLGRSDGYRALVFEWMPGLPLNAQMDDSSFEPDTVRAVGGTLADLHTQKANRLQYMSREAEAVAVLAAARGVGAVCPRISDRVYDIALRLAGRLLGAPLAPREERAIHGDFYADQVLIAEDRITFLDFDSAVRGDPAADLGNFIAHLERDALCDNLAPERVRALRGALLEGYRTATGGPLPTRIGLYAAVGLLRLAPEPFRYRDANWPERIAAIVARTEAIMERVE